MSVKLKKSFYLLDDVVALSKALLGKYLCTKINGKNITSGMITETEAYAGVTDKASHAYSGRRSERTEVMYMEGGTAYVYLCYGMHSLFNVVTNKINIPHAILIRAIEPVQGIEIMLERTGVNVVNKKSGTGPGKVAKLLGIHYTDTGTSLLGNKIWIEDRGVNISDDKILSGPRVGVDYAGEDAKRLYRFRIK